MDLSCSNVGVDSVFPAVRMEKQEKCAIVRDGIQRVPERRMYCEKQISVLTALLTAAAFAVIGCGASGDNAAPSASSKAASQEVPEETEHSEVESTEAENTGAETGSEAVSEEEKEGSGASAVRVGSLKGPTSMDWPI